MPLSSDESRVHTSAHAHHTRVMRIIPYTHDAHRSSTRHEQQMMVISSPLGDCLALWSSHCQVNNRPHGGDSADPYYQTLLCFLWPPRGTRRLTGYTFMSAHHCRRHLSPGSQCELLPIMLQIIWCGAMCSGTSQDAPRKYTSSCCLRVSMCACDVSVKKVFGGRGGCTRQRTLNHSCTLRSAHLGARRAHSYSLYYNSVAGLGSAPGL